MTLTWQSFRDYTVKSQWRHSYDDSLWWFRKWCQNEVTWRLSGNQHMESILRSPSSMLCDTLTDYFLLASLAPSSQNNHHSDFSVKSPTHGHMRVTRIASMYGHAVLRLILIWVKGIAFWFITWPWRLWPFVMLK